MKYVVILGDGMADYGDPAQGNKTPLMLAKKPNIDSLARRGEVGMAHTIPAGMKPGSDVANLSVMGYAPEKYYSGRSPLEALSIGVDLAPRDVAVRCNLVTLSAAEPFCKKTMLDYSAGEISSAEAKQLISALQEALSTPTLNFYAGVSYRHCLVLSGGSVQGELTPPHDISDKEIGDYLPKGENASLYLDLIQKSEQILAHHPINLKRIAEGKHPATHIWLWGAGTKPQLPAFQSLYGLRGAVISAVDLLKGIAIAAKMQVVNVPGATGTLQTNFKGKAEAVISTLKAGADYVYLHIEAPDECGHQGDRLGKIAAIEKVDEVCGYIERELQKLGEPYTILVTPDHATPLCCKTHVSDPVPFALFKSDAPKNMGQPYDEEHAKLGATLATGDQLLKQMLKR